MWVITESINEYNQEGDYLVCVFAEKPDEAALMTLKITAEYARHLLRGGGRQGTEGSWWYLTELQEGEVYRRRK